jgi:hypothetical protein
MSVSSNYFYKISFCEELYSLYECETVCIIKVKYTTSFLKKTLQYQEKSKFCLVEFTLNTDLNKFLQITGVLVCLGWYKNTLHNN